MYGLQAAPVANHYCGQRGRTAGDELRMVRHQDASPGDRWHERECLCAAFCVEVFNIHRHTMSATITVSDGVSPDRVCVLRNDGSATWPAMGGHEMVRALRWLFEAEASLQQQLERAVGDGKAGDNNSNAGEVAAP
jgi:hypothetical protein